MEIIEEIKWLTEKSTIEFRILPTFFDSRTRISTKVLDDLKKHFGDKLFNTVIRVNTAIKEAPGSNKTIYEHAPLSRGAYDYYKLTEEVLALENES